jgi:hypothetical protein
MCEYFKGKNDKEIRQKVCNVLGRWTVMLLLLKGLAEIFILEKSRSTLESLSVH